MMISLAVKMMIVMIIMRRRQIDIHVETEAGLNKI